MKIMIALSALVFVSALGASPVRAADVMAPIDIGTNAVKVETVIVPEPASLSVLALGGAALLIRRRQRH